MTRSSRTERNPLRRRLAQLRRRLRLVVVTRAVGWLFATLCLTIVGMGLLDWSWQLPPLFRALALVGTLTGMGVIALRQLIRPLLGHADDLTLALRIEERYPSLNDALASTVQFLEQAERRERKEEGPPVAPVSPAMRLEAVRRALKKAEGCDFNRVIDTRGLRTASVTGLLSLVAALALLVLFPNLALTAVARLTDPFGQHEWPRATQIELEAFRTRIGRNEAFEVRATLSGVLPEKANVIYRLDGSTAIEQEWRVARDPKTRTGQVVALFRPGQFTRSFTFQLSANDASTDWHRVEVAPAPMLDLLDGKPSPQVRLFFPEYSSLSPRSLPDGVGNIEAVTGTLVTLRAAANVPLRAAWIEYHPESPGSALGPIVSPLGSDSSLSALGHLAVTNALAGRQYATLDAQRRGFFVRFLPQASGSYSLHFEDETGLGNHRVYELRLRPDPSPTVVLERPSALKENLEVLPTATLPLRILAEDPTFALRSVWLEYRVQPEAPYRRLPLFAPGQKVRNLAAGAVLGTALWSATRGSRPQNVLVEQPLVLTPFQHEEGRALRAGDVLTLRAAADDFDDLHVGKPPGYSSEVEIRILSREAVELTLNREEARVQQELTEVRQLQTEALKQVTEIENKAARARQLTPDDLANLSRAEQAQMQVRERLDAENQESVRARVDRILESLQQNRLERSAVQQRMEMVRNELERLRRQELEQIENRLSTARKLTEIPDEARNDRQADELERAAERAETQARRLDELMRNAESPMQKARLEAWRQTLRQQTDQLRKEARAVKAEEPNSKESAKASAERARRLEQLGAERQQGAEELQRLAAQDSSGQDRDLNRLAQEMKQDVDRLRQQAQEQANRAQTNDANDLKARLTEARRGQEEVHKTLGALLQSLERWSSAREVRAEVRSLLEEQRRLADETNAMQRQGSLGSNLNELTPEQRARLDTAANGQERLRERLRELQNKMKRLSEERKENDPETAREMREAAEQASRSNLAEEMKFAREQLEQNQLGRAAESQQRTLGELEKLVKKLEDRREADLDQAIKRMREQERLLDELAERQDRLRKKIREAEQIKDPKEREETLRRLAREQQQLQQETQEMARQLSRMRAERAGEALNQAARQMQESVRTLERGEAPQEQPDEALDRLEDGLDDLEKARNANEEELGRELLERVAETLKRLKERQDRLVEEGERLKKEVLERKGWSRGLTISLNSLNRNQEGLASECRALADRELSAAPIFARILRRSAEAMTDACQGMSAHREQAVQQPPVASYPEKALEAQKLAQQRLQQLLEALKMEAGMSVRPPQAKEPDAEAQEGGSGREMGDNIPPSAQLKLLRQLQAEVNQHTQDFARQHADLTQLNATDRQQLQKLQREQREIADLIEALTRAAGEGEMK